MHKPKVSLTLATPSLHPMLHPPVVLPLVKTGGTVERGLIEIWTKKPTLEKHPPEKSNAPATHWQRCVVWKVQYSCLYFCNSM